MLFSERNGYKKVSDAIVRENLTQTQRTSIWNVLKSYIWDHWQERDYVWTEDSREINVFLRRLWVQHFKADLDTLPPFRSSYRKNHGYQQLKDHVLRAPWYDVLDFIEFCAGNLPSLFSKSCRDVLNSFLKRDCSAYRLVGSTVTEISDEHEISTIEDAEQVRDESVRSHLNRALSLLSDRESPDYRNSIKESISAVEAACRSVTGDDKATLGKAIKKIDGLHPALSSAFNSLYGFTNDSHGIRHALTDSDKQLEHEDAKFMLVACSAFINYLEAKRVVSSE